VEIKTNLRGLCERPRDLIGVLVRCPPVEDDPDDDDEDDGRDPDEDPVP